MCSKQSVLTGEGDKLSALQSLVGQLFPSPALILPYEKSWDALHNILTETFAKAVQLA